MDINYEDLLKEYGNEYLSETDPDAQLLDMFMLNEVLPQDPEDPLLRDYVLMAGGMEKNISEISILVMTILLLMDMLTMYLFLLTMYWHI